METYNLTNDQGRNFILLKQGLIGDYKFEDKGGVCDYVRQAGCIQFDPIDICGKNPELVLHSRVLGFTKEMLYQLLYEDRKLIDYFDKNMSIFRVEDWEYFARLRENYRSYGRSHDKVDKVAGEIKGIIKEKGCVSSKDIDLKQMVDWPWAPTTLSRAVLETLYFRGDLIIHHKKGNNKYYSLAEDYIEEMILNTEDPNKTEDDFTKWQVLRRIGSVGLLWNKASDAWLGINKFNGERRNNIFSLLLSENKIVGCKVEGIQATLYFLKEDEELIKTVLSQDAFKQRLEFIAPLDNMLWDRKLIRALFDFDYKWEIYTPKSQRKYGYYVLPVLYGNRFVGRIEIVLNKKVRQLNVLNFWKEGNTKIDDDFYKLFQTEINQFMFFNHCETFKIKCKI